MNYIIDMHCHSTCSDGFLQPEVLAQKQIDTGTNFFSITDHDNFEAMYTIVDKFPQYVYTEENLQNFKKGLIKTLYIPGIEISTCCNITNKKYHLCAYAPFLPTILLKQKNNQPLTEDERIKLDNFMKLKFDVDEKRKLRITRMQKLFDRLINEYHLDKEIKNGELFSWEDFIEFCKNELKFNPLGGETSVGRPHVASYLFSKGLCKDRQDAFDKYLVKANVTLTQFDLEETVKRLTEIGMFSILAHPFIMKDVKEDLDNNIEILVKNGLTGLEAYHAEESKENTDYLLSKIEKYNLISSSGSDYHDTQSKGEIGNIIKCSQMTKKDQKKFIKVFFNIDIQ